MIQFILLVFGGLLAAILFLLRRRQLETLPEPVPEPQQPKQPTEDAKPLARPCEETDGRISNPETSQRKESEAPDVHLRVEGEVVRDLHLQLLLEDQIPELKGEIRSGSMQRVQDNTVLVRISQTGEYMCYVLCVWADGRVLARSEMANRRDRRQSANVNCRLCMDVTCVPFMITPMLPILCNNPLTS